MKISLVFHEGSQLVAAHTARGFINLEALCQQLGVEIDSDPVAFAMSPSLALLEAALHEAPVLSGRIRILPPLKGARKVICMARNYRLHAEESGFCVPSEPIYFSKASSCLIGHGEPIRVPEGIGRVDPEAELAVIIGREVKRGEDRAGMECIAGYTCFNDVTARDLQSKDVRGGEPWFRSKSFDTFAPMGPFLVTKGDIPDPHALGIRLWVGSDLRQDSSTSRMVFTISTIIRAITSVMSLEPGDVIATGTPEGIAPIYPGDTVCVEIDGVGKLTNPVEEGSA